MATATPKGLSMAEMRLLADFSNMLQARQYNSNVTLEKVVLSYDVVNGFAIDLVETPKQVSTPQVPTTTTVTPA